MLERFEKIFAIILIVGLVVVGVVGYSIKTTGSPIRVLFKTKGGMVIFDHREHKGEYDIKCSSCHHEADSEDSNIEWNCRSCHSIGMENYLICEDNPPHKCIGSNCIDCHTKNGIDTTDCKACHK